AKRRPAQPEPPPAAEFQEVTPEPLQPPQAQTAESTTEPLEQEATAGEEPTTASPETETPTSEPVAETEPSPIETPAEVEPQAQPDATPIEPVAEQPGSDTKEGLSALLQQPLFKNPTAWALIGFVLLLLIALPVMFLRRKKAEEGEEDDALFEDRPVPTKLAASNKPEPVTTALGDTVVKKPVPARSAAKPAASPLERIDLLMAGGNYPEAENTARLALREEPKNTALAVKLLDIYFATKNQDEFLTGAQAVHDNLNNKTDPLSGPRRTNGPDSCP
ncbi:MAG: hypothetical protein HC808_20370, partial [Candidatus Competibacteraceae bacterium]|nr:hypothetical protein [Candidatus Competibacteraceae bacterium]